MLNELYKVNKRCIGWIMVVGLLLSLTAFFILISGQSARAVEKHEGWWLPGQSEIQQRVEEMDQQFNHAVRGIYVPTSILRDSESREALFQLIRDTEINSLVIDVKDDNGWITYDSSLTAVKRYGTQDDRLGDLSELASELEDEGIYAIGRLVVFKDSRLPHARPELGIQRRQGGIWRDALGTGWVDPYNRETWDYNIDIAVEVIEAGFCEVQFDYVRFPTDGQMDSVVLPWEDKRFSQAQVIEGFLRKARWKTAAAGGWISADVFGLVPSVVDDMGMGQNWERIAGVVDYISPMIYPSHYGSNIYGLPVPEADPYSTVWHSLQDGVRRLDDSDGIIRPWLQDFSAAYTYGPAEVRASIEATYDVGLDSWMLWNAWGVYTREALLPIWNNSGDD